jgi:RES domain-containing protein
MLPKPVSTLLRWLFGPKLTLEQKIRQALPSAIEFSGVCYRSVSQKFATRKSVTSAAGSLITGGRYNLKGAFEVLYLALDVHTCTEEVTRSMQVSEFVVADSLPRTTIAIEVKLSRVLDLTDSRILRELGVSAAVLAGTDWKNIQNNHGREAITQEIGRYAREAGFEALLVPSSVWNGKNLDIFPDKLQPTSNLSSVNIDRLMP